MTQVEKNDEEFVADSCGDEDDLVIINAIQDEVESDEQWEERMAEAEKQARDEARIHIEKMRDFPDYVVLAIQAEMERSRIQAQTMAARRESRGRLRVWREKANEQQRRRAALKSIAKVLSVAAIAVTGAVIVSSMFSEFRSYFKSAPALCPAKCSLGDIEKTSQSTVIQTTSSQPPRRTEAICSSSSNQNENVKYIIVRQKVDHSQ